jgi:hypothetical protein
MRVVLHVGPSATRSLRSTLRQLPALSSNKDDGHDMCRVRILQQDTENAFWRYHLGLSILFLAELFVYNAKLREGGVE